jgi:hypothetical protein
MKKIKDIVISKGKKAQIGPVHTRDITLGDVLECFFPERGYEYDYLGYAYYRVKEDGSIIPGEQIIKEFLQQVDRVARPKLCPRFVLHLLNLFGNDKSIVRMRSLKLHNMFSRLTGGIRITDMKWKYDSFRIYGSFTKELDRLAQETCRKLEEEYADED